MPEKHCRRVWRSVTERAYSLNSENKMMGCVLPSIKKGPAWESSLGPEAILSTPSNPVSLYCCVVTGKAAVCADYKSQRRIPRETPGVWEQSIMHSIEKKNESWISSGLWLEGPTCEVTNGQVVT